MGFAYTAKAAATTTPTTPDGWPFGWTFPPDEDGPWPPGWPEDDPGTVTITVDVPAKVVPDLSIGLLMQCVDAAGDPIDTLELHRVKVSATMGGAVCQLKKELADAMADAIYYQVTDIGGGRYGVEDGIFLDVAAGDDGETVTVTCAVVSVEPVLSETDTTVVEATFAVATADFDAPQTYATYLASCYNPDNDEFGILFATGANALWLTIRSAVDLSQTLAPVQLTGITTPELNAGGLDIAWDGTGYGVIYRAWRGGKYAVAYAQIDRAGTTLNAADIEGTSSPALTGPFHIAWNGTEYGIIYTNPAASTTVRFARINTAGVIQGSAATVTNAVAGANNSANDSGFDSDGTGWLIAYPKSGGSIQMRYVSAAGVQSDEVQVVAAGTVPYVCWNGTYFGIGYDDGTHSKFVRSSATPALVGNAITVKSNGDDIKLAPRGGGWFACCKDSGGNILAAIHEGTDAVDPTLFGTTINVTTVTAKMDGAGSVARNAILVDDDVISALIS